MFCRTQRRLHSICVVEADPVIRGGPGGGVCARWKERHLYFGFLPGRWRCYAARSEIVGNWHHWPLGHRLLSEEERWLDAHLDAWNTKRGWRTC